MVHEDQSIFDSPREPSLMEDQEEPDTQNSSPSPGETIYKSLFENDSPEKPESEPVLPPTLETRKKKNKSAPIVPLEAVTADREQPTRPCNDQETRKSGSKRKFCPEDDEQLSSTLNVEEDEFQFSRPTHSPKKQMKPFELTRREQSPLERHFESPVKAKIETTRGANILGPPKRRVLETSMFSEFFYYNEKFD